MECQVRNIIIISDIYQETLFFDFGVSTNKGSPTPMPKKFCVSLCVCLFVCDKIFHLQIPYKIFKYFVTKFWS